MIETTILISRDKPSGKICVSNSGMLLDAYDMRQIDLAREQLSHYGDYSLWPDEAVVEADFRVRMALCHRTKHVRNWGEPANGVQGVVTLIANASIVEAIERVEDRYGLPNCDAIASRATNLGDLIYGMCDPQPWREDQRIADGIIRVAGLNMACDCVLVDITDHPYCPERDGDIERTIRDVRFAARCSVDRIRQRRLGRFDVQVA